jgi:hypothetical protein
LQKTELSKLISKTSSNFGKNLKEKFSRIPEDIMENMHTEFDPDDPRYAQDQSILVEKILMSFSGLKLGENYHKRAPHLGKNTTSPYPYTSSK